MKRLIFIKLILAGLLSSPWSQALFHKHVRETSPVQLKHYEVQQENKNGFPDCIQRLNAFELLTQTFNDPDSLNITLITQIREQAHKSRLKQKSDPADDC